MKTQLKLFCFLLTSSLHAQNSDFGLSVGLDNKVGIGTFVTDKKAEQLISTLALAPYLLVGPLYDDKKLKLSAEQKLDITWLESQASNTQNLKPSDFYMRALLRNALTFSTLNLSLSPMLELELPISTASREVNRFFGLGINSVLLWSYSGFSLGYKPSVAAYIHGTAEKIDDCATKGPEENCLAIKRQSSALIKNTLSSAYSYKNHSITLAFRTYHNFLHDLSLDQFRGEAPKNLKISSLGYLEYSYNMPLRFPLTFTLGLSSAQPLRNDRGNINFPFYDFYTPHNNYSQFYCTLEAIFS
jgi:hypothetical protein